jgi:hypothetical protein
VVAEDDLDGHCDLRGKPLRRLDERRRPFAAAKQPQRDARGTDPLGRAAVLDEIAFGVQG